MHIPDGFLDTKTAVTTGVLATLGVGYALKSVSKDDSSRAPLMGLSAAFVFVAQMINFPVVGGTSGHLIGAVLIAVLLGPGAAVIVLTTVLIVQSLLFADGGVLALGANVFNMAIVACLGGYAVYSMVRRLFSGERGRLLAAIFASWVSIVLASLVCAGELAWSHTVPWSFGFPSMAGIHMVIGLGEALITGLVVAAVGRSRPDLLNRSGSEFGRARSRLVYGSLVTAGLALFVAPFTSSLPDGFEFVTQSLGLRAPEASFITPLFPDYHAAIRTTALAGLVGGVVAFLMAWMLARLLIPARESGDA
jgi:cobalt/nickel transport system permease protein